LGQSTSSITPVLPAVRSEGPHMGAFHEGHVALVTWADGDGDPEAEAPETRGADRGNYPLPRAIPHGGTQWQRNRVNRNAFWASHGRGGMSLITGPGGRVAATRAGTAGATGGRGGSRGGTSGGGTRGGTSGVRRGSSGRPGGGSAGGGSAPGPSGIGSGSGSGGGGGGRRGGDDRRIGGLCGDGSPGSPRKGKRKVGPKEVKSFRNKRNTGNMPFF
jgi:hypothetical protein